MNKQIKIIFLLIISVLNNISSSADLNLGKEIASGLITLDSNLGKEIASGLSIFTVVGVFVYATYLIEKYCDSIPFDLIREDNQIRKEIEEIKDQIKKLSDRLNNIINKINLVSNDKKKSLSCSQIIRTNILGKTLKDKQDSGFQALSGLAITGNKKIDLSFFSKSN